LVSPQIILVTLAVIAFFATGGIDKATRALATAKQDFTRVKGSISGLKTELGEKTAKEELRIPKFTPVDINELERRGGHVDLIPESDKLSLRQNFAFQETPEALKQKLMRGI